MKPTTRMGMVGAVLGFCWLLAAPLAGQEKPAPALPCAVLGTGSADRAAALCSDIGRELGRKTRYVEDGRSVQRGEALHIIHGDVSWTVIWLRDGRPRAFTRVSSIDAQGREAPFLARACRVLRQEAQRVDKECLRIEPNGGRRMRAPELAYPWIELKQCRAHTVEVLDPWWTASAD